MSGTEIAFEDGLLLKPSAWSRGRIAFSMVISASLLSVLLVVGGFGGRLFAAVVFLPAVVANALLYRSKVIVDDGSVVVIDGLGKRTFSAGDVLQVAVQVRPNLGITSFAFYWAFRRRTVTISLVDGRTVRPVVLTSVRHNGQWHRVSS